MVAAAHSEPGMRAGSGRASLRLTPSLRPAPDIPVSKRTAAPCIRKPRRGRIPPRRWKGRRRSRGGAEEVDRAGHETCAPYGPLRGGLRRADVSLKTRPSVLVHSAPSTGNLRPPQAPGASLPLVWRDRDRCAPRDRAQRPEAARPGSPSGCAAPRSLRAHNRTCPGPPSGPAARNARAGAPAPSRASLRSPSGFAVPLPRHPPLHHAAHGCSVSRAEPGAPPLASLAALVQSAPAEAALHFVRRRRSQSLLRCR